MKRHLLCAAVAWLCLAGPAIGQDQAEVEQNLPPIEEPRLPSPPEAERTARAHVAYAPYRYDDILWENDKTAHRIYGPALQKYEPPAGSGIDAWGKLFSWPFMERQLATGRQHGFHGEGIDFYNVGTTRGAGGLGIWQDYKLWTSRNWASHRILRDGPDVAEFEVSYAPWPVNVGRWVSEVRRFSLPLGSNFTRMVSTLKSNKTAPLMVGIGIAKRPTSADQGHFLADRAQGKFTYWSPEDPAKGAMGVAILVDPMMIADVTQDADNFLIILRVQPGKPFTYYSGSTWSKRSDFPTQSAWTAHVVSQKPSFAVDVTTKPRSPR